MFVCHGGGRIFVAVLAALGRGHFDSRALGTLDICDSGRVVV